jgi:hypothetical protein
VTEIVGDLPGLIHPLRLLLLALYEHALSHESHFAFIKVLDPFVFALPDDSFVAIRHPVKHPTLADSDFIVGNLEHAEFGDIDQVDQVGNRALLPCRITYQPGPELLEPDPFHLQHGRLPESHYLVCFHAYTPVTSDFDPHVPHLPDPSHRIDSFGCIYFS